MIRKIGLLVNPISGMGGSVGLKGTDGEDTLKKAIELGAIPKAPKKAKETCLELNGIKDKIIVFTGSRDMGENSIINTGLRYKIVYRSEHKETSSTDSINLLKIFKKEKVDLIVFAGGDGTARIVSDIIGMEIPCIGIPTGVKIHSPVFAINPINAGKLSTEFISNKLPLSTEEVLDLNEDLYRKDIFDVKLFGYLKIPYMENYLQNKKAPSPLSKQESIVSIALDIIDNMEQDIYYIIGAGSTTSLILQELGQKNTLLGIDIIKNKKIVIKDANENDLLNITKNNKSKLILSPIGGQGFLLGRGNQQISHKVINNIKKENIIIISDLNKIINLRGKPLIVYTGNKITDDYLTGYYKVKIGYRKEMMYKVSK